MNQRLKQHKAFFTEFEMGALELICTRIGKKPEDLSRDQIADLLCHSYSLPYNARVDIDRCLAGLKLAAMMLRTFRRYEIEAHLSNPAFVTAVASIAAKLADEMNDLANLLMQSPR